MSKDKDGDSDISCLKKQVASLKITVAEMMAKIKKSRATTERPQNSYH